jgi:ATP-dependent DNA helicase RecG
MDLKTSVDKLFMVGPAYAKKLQKLNIQTVEDLLYHFPFRYQDYSLISPISKVQPGEVLTINGKILSIKNEYLRSGRKIQKAQVLDNSGQMEIVWFNQPFLVRILKVGEKYSFSGKVDWFGRKKVMISPEYELLFNGKPIHTGRLAPVYPETKGLSSKWLRSYLSKLIEQLLPIEDFLPAKIKKENDLIDFSSALKQIHFPESLKQVDQARKRFAFEELFLLHLKVSQRKKVLGKSKLASQFLIDQEKILKFAQNLPFEMTSSQKKVCREILNDLSQKKPMNRLLQGDVGSGKTVVAALAVYVAWLSNTQSILMAPTEILANQHYQTLKHLLESLGVKISLLTASHKIKNSDADLLVGTHALIYHQAKFKKLGLVIIDEQHRFGVEQRSKLIKKAIGNKTPHTLTMTATPIPRTIALTLYGDLDLSVIDQMPEGRQKIKTWVVPPQKRTGAYEWIRKRVKETDEQCFIICPLIEPSETLQTVKAAKAEYEQLSQKVFPDLRLGLLHGKMKSQEKEKVIGKFRAGDLDILVSTPVVEVGIDIPQATIMVIEESQRFGLSQLHQLRGRVGRGNKESFCLLFSEVTSGKAFERIKALERINIGFKLAELDLKMRGPGEVYGTSQHGFFNLRIASFADLPLIEKTQKAAEDFFPDFEKYPLLKAKMKEDTIKNIQVN